MQYQNPTNLILVIIVSNTLAWACVCFLAKSDTSNTSGLYIELAAVVAYLVTSFVLIAIYKSSILKNREAIKQTRAHLLAQLADPSTDSSALLKLSLSELAQQSSKQLEGMRQAESIIVEYSSEVLCLLDERFRILELNANAESIWEFQAISLLGAPLTELAVQNDRPKFVEHLIKCTKKNDGESHFECQVATPAGKIIDISWKIEWSPSLKLFYCIGTDISELKRIERLRAELMAMVSHDLRAPVSALSLFLQSLQDGNLGTLSEAGRVKALYCRDSVDQMLRLINQLLDAEKLESGEITIQAKDIKLSAVAQASINMLNPLAEKKNIEIVLHDDEELTVHADLDRSVQILCNLLSNAIKWSPENDRIEVRVVTMSFFAAIEVKDNGPGIPEEQQKKIFERFKMLTEIETKPQSSGLGLYLAENLARLQGGQIGLQSEPGEGSTFWFTLKRVGV